MSNLIHPLSAALLVLCAGFSASALAHNPMCECKAIDAEQIKCTGGFSDGSGAPGVTLDVIGYDETILVPGKLGADCAGCHETATWSQGRFDHDKTRFALRERHAEVTCSACPLCCATSKGRPTAKARSQAPWGAVGPGSASPSPQGWGRSGSTRRWWAAIKAGRS